MDIVNLYEILKVKRTASHKEIKKSYRNLILKCHPDKGGSQVEFELITSAYAIIGNEQERALYDKLYKEQKEEDKSDWLNMKKSNEEFMRDYNNKHDKDNSIELFNKYMEEMNSKCMNVTNKDIIKNLETTVTSRDEQLSEINNKTAKIKVKNMNEFNEIFEKEFRKNNEVIKYTGGIHAWNNEDKYGTFDDFGKLYEEDNNKNIYDSHYGSINVFESAN